MGKKPYFDIEFYRLLEIDRYQSEIEAFLRTDRQTESRYCWIDSASDAEQGYAYILWDPKYLPLLYSFTHIQRVQGICGSNRNISGHVSAFTQFQLNFFCED